MPTSALSRLLVESGLSHFLFLTSYLFPSLFPPFPSFPQPISTTQARGHASAITCATCCVTQDRELRVLTGSFDKTLRLWDGDGSSLARFQGHAGLVTAVAITKVLIV